MNNPIVSIIVPCYNQAQYLDECLQSVLNQTYEKWECIIVNDGSPDQTDEIVQKWLDKDSRFQYVYKKNGGLSSARNFGLNVAKGEYIQFLDSDDVLDSNKFELSLLEANRRNTEQGKIIITNFRIFSVNSKNSIDPFCEIKYDYLNFKELLLGWDSKFSIPIHCGLFEVSLLKNFKFSEEIRAKEDWLMWLEVFKKKPELLFIDKPLVYYRTHAGSMTYSREFMTKSLIDVLPHIDKIVSKEEFNELLLIRLKDALEKTNNFEKKYRSIKESNSFKVGLKIKTILKQFYLLFFAKKVMNFFK
ncbi:glycosyltransferase family 2 protein [Flavobacterium sp. A45]|uniref:glycosyltransferase family 2 protein n=1 Tax=Flavobacterium sp. A45 TaxID=1945862 RepID=UPI0009861111|nr:glycosyltransferase family 2 protein [Flavobacterium sp. A45]